jgi:hypothetical protein
MKIYFIKYNQPYNEQDSDVFEKDCFEIEDKFLPVRLNWGEVIGKCKVYSDKIGAYFEEIEYQEDKIKIDFKNDLKLEFAFLVDEAENEKNIRHIKKAKLMELNINMAAN